MHIHVADTDAIRCTAFGQKDKRRCRLKRQKGELTCQIHINYYRNWYQTHRFFDRYYMSRREIDELEFQIQHHYVTIPPEWVVQLYTPGERAWYPFIIENTHLSPALHPDCFQSLFYNTFLYNTVWNNQNYMQSYVRDVETCLLAFTMILEWSMQQSHGGLYSCMDLMRVYMEKLNWHPILYSVECSRIVYMREARIRSLFSSCTEDPIQFFDRCIQSFHARAAKSIRDRCGQYKEELVATALAPRRIQRLLDMGYDLDVLDHV
jgi:hypothetical protein